MSIDNGNINDIIRGTHNTGTRCVLTVKEGQKMSWNEFAMLNISTRRNEELIQKEAQKAEFAKTWIGQKKSKMESAKEKQQYLKWSQML